MDRYASFEKDWKKDWEEGIIIADRYTTSNAVHQCSKLPEEEWDKYLDWLFNYEYSLLNIPAPYHVIYLRVDPEVSRKLLYHRYSGDSTKEDIHEKDAEYLNRCRTAADYCAKKLGWTIVECCKNDEIRSKDDIQQEIQKLITLST